MTSIKVLEMTIEDLNNISNILTTHFDDFWNINVLKSELENPLSKYIVAKENDEIVGFAGIIDTVDQFEITNIIVKKNCRAKGIGTLLLQNLIAISKKCGKNKIYLEVDETNYSAIKLYEKNGFKKCGLRKKYYNNINNAILMQLTLN